MVAGFCLFPDFPIPAPSKHFQHTNAYTCTHARTLHRYPQVFICFNRAAVNRNPQQILVSFKLERGDFLSSFHNPFRIDFYNSFTCFSSQYKSYFTFPFHVFLQKSKKNKSCLMKKEAMMFLQLNDHPVRNDHSSAERLQNHSQKMTSTISL